MSAIAFEGQDGIKAAIQKWVAAGSGFDDPKVYWEKQGQTRPAPPFIELSVPSIFQPSHDWVTREINPLLGQGPAASTVVIADRITSTFVAPGHKFLSGDGPIRPRSIGGNVPKPLDVDTDAWVVRVDDNTLKLAAKFRDTGGNYSGNPITPIALLDGGSGELRLELRPKSVRAGKETKRRAQGIREVTVRLTCYMPQDSDTDAVSVLTDVLASVPLHIYDLDQAGVGMSSVGIADIESGIKSVPGRVGTMLEPRSFCEVTVYVGSEVVGTIGRIDSASVTPVAKITDNVEVTLDPVEVVNTP